MLSRIPAITKYMLGREQDVIVRVYDSKYIGGKPVSQELGFTAIGEDKYIGIKRSQLKDRAEFDNTYIHELGHYVTRVGDHNGRTLLDVFTTRLAKETASIEPEEK